MLRPFIIVGIGGSGGKTLRALRYQIELRLRAAGWEEGIPDAWQFLHIDTPAVQDGIGAGFPFLPPSSYKGLVAAGSTYSTVYKGLLSGIPKSIANQVQRQLPDPDKVIVPILSGAGQYRAVGRTIVLSKLNEVGDFAEQAVNRIKAPTALSRLADLGELLGANNQTGTDGDPVVMFVTSIAGGSGSGQYLDVVEAVKAKFAATSWARETYGILFAPDVFDGISGTEGIPANALATISETASGHWNRFPNAATQEIFASKGLTILSGDANDRIGVRYPLVIGRQGANAAFADQIDVYRAVASTITAWMTDDEFQDQIAAYVKTNFTRGVEADSLPDRTDFGHGENRPPALGSIGFGRVTLAREKFIEYSAERLARAMIDRILKGHAEQDPHFQTMSEDAWIKQFAEKSQVSFSRDSGLNEETEENDDIINALRAAEELTVLSQEFKFAVRALSADPSTLDKNGGLPVDTWYERIITARASQVAKYLEIDTANRQRKLDEWVLKTPEEFVKVVIRYIAQLGAPVVSLLLDGLIKSLNNASEQLKTESNKYATWAANIAGYVYDDLAAAGAGQSIRPDHDAVEAALARVEQSLSWESEVALRLTASNLIKEFIADFVNPLKIAVNGSAKALRVNIDAKLTSDGRENDFPFWPARESASIAKKFEPSTNEKMLLEPNEFSAEFERLVSATVGLEKYPDAAVLVIAELMSGGPKEQLITISKSWKPVVAADPTMKRADGQTPGFEMKVEPIAYLERSKVWMERLGTPFRGFITQTIKDYLDKDNLAPDVYNERKKRFLSHLLAAFKSAGPLIKLNPSLLNEVHQKSIGEGDKISVSAIPFDSQHDMYVPVLNALVSEISKSPSNNASISIETQVQKWFRDQNADSIEFMTVMGYPVEPMVMDSVMKPVSGRWNQVSLSAASREAFMRWSRGRLLAESLPFDKDRLRHSIRGWYIASMSTGMLEYGSDKELGERISIKSSDGKMLPFPHPLFAGNFKQKDTIAVVLDSVKIAQAECNAKGTLAPLAAHKRLIELGDDTNIEPLNEEFSARFQFEGGNGRQLTEEEFKKKVEAAVAYLDGEKEIVEGAINGLTNPYDFPLVWEIADDVISAIDGLRAQITQLDYEGGVRQTSGGVI